MADDTSQTKATTIPPTAGGAANDKRAIPGYSRFRKIVDFGNSATTCFDLENPVKSLAVPVIGPNSSTIAASPVFIVDPCQSGQTPLKIATILPTHSNRNTTDFVNSTGVFGIYTTRENVTDAGFSVDADYAWQSFTSLSATNTTNVLQINLRNQSTILAIHMTASAGTATLTVEARVDGGSYLNIDTIAAAAATDLQYTLASNVLNGSAQAGSTAGTGVGTVKLNPLAFPQIRITGGAAGVGNTTTLLIGIK